MHIVYARRGYDAKYEAPEHRPLFDMARPLHRPQTTLHVSSAAAMGALVTKGAEGRLAITLANAVEGQYAHPYVVAERSIHESTMPLSEWLQVCPSTHHVGMPIVYVGIPTFGPYIA